MKKDQIHLLIGIATPLLLVAILLIQLQHGQQNLTRAIISLHPQKETDAIPKEPLEPLRSVEQEEGPKGQSRALDKAVVASLPKPPSAQNEKRTATDGPPPNDGKPLTEARPLPGELIQSPEITEGNSQTATHITYQPITINHIYPRLQPFGRWHVHPRHGNVWMPHASRRDPHWRPYAQNGQWFYTADGWHWQSNYQWGGTTFHHGRWFWESDRNGWLWVPGREWSPAWVTWRDHGDNIGWAPIPPTASVSPTPTPSSRATGTSGVHIDYSLDNNHFTFVPKADFLDENPLDFVLSKENSLAAFQNSRSRDRIMITNQRRWANFGIQRQEMAQAIGKPIEIVMVDLRNPYQPRIVTEKDFEALTQQTANNQDRSSETQEENTRQAGPSSAGVNAPIYWPNNRGFRGRSQFGQNNQNQFSGGVQGSSPAPIVIDGSTKTTNQRSGTQYNNASGLGTRRGQPRPNLSVRQPPSGQ